MPATITTLRRLGWIVLCCGSLAAQPPQAPAPIKLEPGQRLEREIKGGQFQPFHVQLEAGQFARVEVEQRGIDLVINVMSPANQYISFANDHRSKDGVESANIVAETAGLYTFSVSSGPDRSAPLARYEIRIAEVRAPTEQETLRYRTRKAIAEVSQLRQRKDAESQRLVPDKYEEAIRLYDQLGERAEATGWILTLANFYATTNDAPKISTTWNRLAQRLEAEPETSATAENLIAVGAGFRRLYKFQQSLVCYHRALRIFEGLQDRNGIVRVTNGMARIYTDIGNYQKVIELRTKAKEEWQMQGNRLWEGISIIEIAAAYRSLGDYDKSLAAHHQAAQIFRELGNQQNLGGVLNGLTVLYAQTGNYPQALAADQEAIRFWEAWGNHAQAATRYAHLARMHSALGNLPQARESLQKAVASVQLEGSQSDKAFAQYAISSAYFQVGAEAEALAYAQRALTETRAFAQQALMDGRAVSFPQHEASLLRLLANHYSNVLGDREKAVGYLNQALAVYRRIDDRAMEANLLWEMSATWMETDHLNVLKFWQQRNAAAQKVYELNEQSRLGYQQLNDPMESLPLAVLSSYYAVKGDRQKALEYSQRALLLSQEIHANAKAPLRCLLSHTQTALGEHQKAVAVAELAYREFNEAPDGKANIAYVLANKLRAVGRLAEAKAKFEEAITIRESYLSRYADTEVRQAALANFQNFYEDYLELLMQIQRQSAHQEAAQLAFQVSERARARSLLEMMREARADIRRDADPTLLARERALQNKVDTLAALLTKQTEGQLEAALLDATKKDIEAVLEELRRTRAQLKQTSPRYAALVQPQPPSVRDIQKQLLDANTMLLSFALGNERSYLFAITPTEFTSYELPPRAEIEKATRRVYDLLTLRQRWQGLSEAQQQQQLATADRSYQTEAAQLSQLLLGPIAAQLGTKRLLIVAPEALQYLPFGTLPTPVVGGRWSVVGQNQPLIVNHEIINLPSASVLLLLREELKGRAAAAKTVAVLADPVFEASDPRVRNVAAVAQHKTLSRLREGEVAPPLERSLRSFEETRAGLARLILSRDEAEAIASALPEAQRLKALDFQANRAAATSQALQQYRIVHFATHGLLNAEFAELSGLVFSLVDEQGQPQDGFLRLHEIYNLQLPAELVVLSACQTGLGKEIKGEGMIGLTRGFMHAGAARVVASLWRVDDYATSVLMKRFYRGMLQEKLRPAAALRQAQIEMWKQKQWQSPFYWGAFTLQGEWK